MQQIDRLIGSNPQRRSRCNINRHFQNTFQLLGYIINLLAYSIAKEVIFRQFKVKSATAGHTGRTRPGRSVAVQNVQLIKAHNGLFQFFCCAGGIIKPGSGIFCAAGEIPNPGIINLRELKSKELCNSIRQLADNTKDGDCNGQYLLKNRNKNITDRS